MALSLGNVTTNSGSSAAPSVATPAGSVGDLVIVVINHNSDTTTSADNNGAAPTTEQIEALYQPGVGGGRLAVYSRVLDGTEGATLDFTMSGSQRWAIIAFIVSGEDTSTPFDTAFADGNDESSSAPTCPGVTTATDGAMAIAVAGQDGSIAFTGGPATFTEVATVNLQQSVSVFYKIITPAGATGNQDFTLASSANNGTLTIFAVKPASGAVALLRIPKMMLMGCG